MHLYNTTNTSTSTYTYYSNTTTNNEPTTTTTSTKIISNRHVSAGVLVLASLFLVGGSTH
jgi:hypothetical protein